jgi:hypothetical protein
MNKIPTVFERDRATHKVTDAVTPGCEWVLAGEGTATRKYDGTCVMYDGDAWWARREVKPGKQPPTTGFQPISTDPTTGKTVGWEPIEQAPFRRYWAEAVGRPDFPAEAQAGTYELIGPKINGDPEKAGSHALVSHADAEVLNEFMVVEETRDFASIRRTVEFHAADGYEGIVWHHPDGRMAKIKVRDF